MQRLQQAQVILGLVAEARATLDSTLIGWASGNLDDMRAQLNALVAPGFLREVPASALQHYPRYLKALALRAERALRDPTRDQARMLELKLFADALSAARVSGIATTPEWQALRWDLEDCRYRCSHRNWVPARRVRRRSLAARLAALRSATPM